MRAVAFDFGTANGRRDSACSMGLAWIDDGTVTAVEEHLIRPPDMRFSRFNIGIHGIRPEDVADAPGFADLWPSLKLRLAGRLVLAHNAQFDIGVLCAVLSRFGLPWPEASYLCTVHVARRSWPGLSAYKLPVVAAHLRIPLQHHAAGSDADAAARIALAAQAAAGAGSLQDLARMLAIQPGRLHASRHDPCRVLAPAPVRMAAAKPVPVPVPVVGGPLAGRRVVFTGTLTCLTRTDSVRLVTVAAALCSRGSARTPTIWWWAPPPAASSAGVPRPAAPAPPRSTRAPSWRCWGRLENLPGGQRHRGLKGPGAPRPARRQLRT